MQVQERKICFAETHRALYVGWGFLRRAQLQIPREICVAWLYLVLHLCDIKTKTVLLFVFMEECSTGGAWVPQLRSLKITYSLHALLKKKKSNLTNNSHIAFLVLPVCSCGAAAILAFCLCIRPSHSPVCHIMIIWPDALIRIGELLHPEQVEDDTSAHRPHYFINCICGSQCSVEGGVFSPPSVCAGSEYAPVHTVPRCSLAGLVNHLPVTGGGNTTAGLAVQRWRLAHC